MLKFLLMIAATVFALDASTSSAVSQDADRVKTETSLVTLDNDITVRQMVVRPPSQNALCFYCMAFLKRCVHGKLSPHRLRTNVKYVHSTGQATVFPLGHRLTSSLIRLATMRACCANISRRRV